MTKVNPALILFAQEQVKQNEMSIFFQKLQKQENDALNINLHEWVLKGQVRQWEKLSPQWNTSIA